MWDENVEQIAFSEKLNRRIRRFFRGLPKSILETADMVPYNIPSRYIPHPFKITKTSEFIIRY
jgi:hypothetical protein